ncbi:hypothetical protein BHM03_00030194 [Ensete ventricosum]|nr:hypothetical protein BHM03_00030194 [Ensete ventricosum]
MHAYMQSLLGTGTSFNDRSSKQAHMRVGHEEEGWWRGLFSSSRVPPPSRAATTDEGGT